MIHSQYQTFSFAVDDRYQHFIAHAWTPRRGVLRSLSAGRVELCLPFAKKVRGQLESTKVAGVDLGLKDGMVISIYETRGEKPVEIERIFLDQKQLKGKKDEWFQPKTRELTTSNYKGKLYRLRKEARIFQSKRKRFIHPQKKHTKAYWYLRREEKKKWKQISFIHEELVNQFSTRLIAYCLFHEVGYVSFENLKWSSQSAKKEVGFYLSHWQTHWFFAQIQERVERMALEYGLTFFRVSARNSSKNCNRCSKKGNRTGKTFTCPHCGWKGDADLNAARNIAFRGIKYYQKLSNQKLYALDLGSRETDFSVPTSNPPV